MLLKLIILVFLGSEITSVSEIYLHLDLFLLLFFNYKILVVLGQGSYMTISSVSLTVKPDSSSVKGNWKLKHKNTRQWPFNIKSCDLSRSGKK